MDEVERNSHYLRAKLSEFIADFMIPRTNTRQEEADAYTAVNNALLAAVYDFYLNFARAGTLTIDELEAEIENDHSVLRHHLLEQYRIILEAVKVERMKRSIPMQIITESFAKSNILEDQDEHAD